MEQAKKSGLVTIVLDTRFPVPAEGQKWLYRGRAYEVSKVAYYRESDCEVYGYEPAHYKVRALDITETDEGQELLAQATAKAEAARAEQAKIAAMKKAAKEEGEAITLDSNGEQVIVPEGEVILDTFDAYGSGERIIRTATHIWYVVNNGRDGDSWKRNAVRTAGVGAYGWKVQIEKL